MAYRLILGLVVLLSAGCASKHEMAKCSGPAVALNTSRWTPSAEQQAEMNRLVQEACK